MNHDRGYVIRDYRTCHEGQDLRYFQVQVKQSDLAIGVDLNSYSDSLLSLCRNQLIKLRSDIEDYILRQPLFQTTLLPIPLLPGAPEIVKRMSRAANRATVGPMAAVAGTIAEMMGEKLSISSREVVVENGGDIYLKTGRERMVAIFAGQSRFSYRIGIRIAGSEDAIGICTSSGTVGHSLSLGRADAVVIKADSAALADAVATGAGNMVESKADLMKAIAYAQNIPGVIGVLAIKDDQLAAWGQMEIAPIEKEEKP
ncbi:MAG: UPF0280 family protein [Syntrophomonadaceae bacterium]|jgi:ApbE superfamily uncharacterized protein (UPF0280 family)